MAKLTNTNYDAMLIHSGLLDLVTAVTEQAPKYFPWGGVILKMRYKVRTAAGTAAGVINVGKIGSAAYYGTATVATTQAAGYEADMTISQSVIGPGDVLYFNADGGATGTGDVDICVVVQPNIVAPAQ